MNKVEQNSIKRNIEILSERTTNIYELVVILFSAGIFTECEKEIIDSKPSTYQKCCQFYLFLLRKGRTSYQVLLDALISTGNNYAYDLLQNVIEENSFGYNKCVSNFIGREEELEKIRNILLSKKQVMVSGIGGIGKTSLVEKYVELFKPYYENRIVWIDGSSNVDCRAALDFYLYNCHSSDKAEATMIHELYNLYNKARKPWLLVIDNLTSSLDEQTLRALFLEHKGDLDYSHLLITCLEGKAVSSLTISITEVQIRGLTVEDAISILSGNTTSETNQCPSLYLKELASLLCCSPLALQQAFGYLETEYCVLHSSQDKYKLYLEEISTQRKGYQRILGHSIHGSNKTIHAVIELAVKKVKLEPGGDFAINLLEHLSFLGPRKIDKQIIPHLLKNTTVDQFEILRAMNKLAKFKLIEYRNDFIDIHEVVQLYMNHKMEGNGLLQLTGSKRLHSCIFGLYDSIADVENVSVIIPHILAAFHHTRRYCTSMIFSSQLILLVLAAMSEISDNLMRQVLSPFLHEKSFVEDCVALTVSFLIISIMIIYAVIAYQRLDKAISLYGLMLISSIGLLCTFQIVQIFGISDYERFREDLVTVASFYKKVTSFIIIICTCTWYIQTIQRWRTFTNVVNQVHLMFLVNWTLGSLIIFAELYVYIIRGDRNQNPYEFYDPFSIPKVQILFTSSIVVFIFATYLEIICKIPAPQFSIIGKPKALFHFSLSCCVFELCAWVWKKKFIQRRKYTLGLVVLLLILLITMPIFVQKQNEYSLDYVIWNLGLDDKKRLYTLLNHNHPQLFDIEEPKRFPTPEMEDNETFLESVYNKLGKNHKQSSLSLYMSEKLAFLSYKNSHFESARKYYENIAILSNATPEQIYNLMVIHVKINSSAMPQNLVERFDNLVSENFLLISPVVLHKFNELKLRFHDTRYVFSANGNETFTNHPNRGNELEVIV